MAKKTPKKANAVLEYPDFTFDEKNKAVIRFNDACILTLTADIKTKALDIKWNDEINNISISNSYDLDSSFLTVQADTGTIFDLTITDIQEDIAVDGDYITGTLKYVASGSSVEYWNTHYFLALKFVNIPDNVTSVKVGITNLVELDEDADCLFAITDLNLPVRVIMYGNNFEIGKAFYLNKLILEEEV